MSKATPPSTCCTILLSSFPTPRFSQPPILFRERPHKTYLSPDREHLAITSQLSSVENALPLHRRISLNGIGRSLNSKRISLSLSRN